jgi:hypothetical protein
MNPVSSTSLSRRSLLAAGGAALAATALGGPAIAASGAATAAPASGGIGLPVNEMTAILQADGIVSGAVLEVDIDRSDLDVLGPDGVKFVDGFQLQHEFFFQQLAGGTAIMNGDMALRPTEIQPVIDGLTRLGFTFQAFHQHLYNITPMVWFIHLRQVGQPLDLLAGCTSW